MRSTFPDHDEMTDHQPRRWRSLFYRSFRTPGGRLALTLVLLILMLQQTPSRAVSLAWGRYGVLLSQTGLASLLASQERTTAAQAQQHQSPLAVDLAAGPAPAAGHAQVDPLFERQPPANLLVPQPSLTPEKHNLQPTELQSSQSAPAATAVPEPTEAPPSPTPAPEPPPSEPAAEQAAAQPAPLPLLMDDWRFTSEPIFTTAAVQALLERYPGPLKGLQLSVGDRSHSVAEVIVSQSVLYSFNPKILLTVMEMQRGLLSNSAPPPEALSSIHTEISWIAAEIFRGERCVLSCSELYFSDQSVQPLPAGLNAASIVVLRLLATTTTPDQLQSRVDAFVSTYTQLFEDPRQPLGESLPGPAEPFLSYPKATRSPITSFFDHEYPFLIQNGSLLSYTGRHEDSIGYDGHTGWDYGGRMGGAILAAAPGTVVFAGNSADGCWTPARAVIIDHGNGYQTLYWHLNTLAVQTGQQVERGQPLGDVGDSGCAAGPHLHFQVMYLGRNTDPYGWCGNPDADIWAKHPFGMVSRWLWVDNPSPCGLPSDGILVSAGGEGFSADGGWNPAPVGVQGGSFWTVSRGPEPPAPPAPPAPSSDGFSALTVDQPPPAPPAAPPLPPAASATWKPQLPGSGRYRVLAYIPYFSTGRPDTTSVRYVVHHADGDTELHVDQSLFANGWVDLGTYTFDPEKNPAVTLTNRAQFSWQGVWAGSVLWMPAGP